MGWMEWGVSELDWTGRNWTLSVADEDEVLWRG